jgi:hypothetical protein
MLIGLNLVFKKIEEIIFIWCNIWLSQGCRLVLVKFVLESIHVYWMSIAHIPKRYGKVKMKEFL